MLTNNRQGDKTRCETFRSYRANITYLRSIHKEIMHKYYYQPVLLTYSHVSLIIQINVFVEKRASQIIPTASC
jgi:hypothetical protein